MIYDLFDIPQEKSPSVDSDIEFRATCRKQCQTRCTKKSSTQFKPKRYELAMKTFVPQDPVEWTAQHVELLTMSIDIDNITERLIADSRFLTDKFQKFTTDLMAGRMGADPTWHYTVRNVTKDVTRLETLKSSLLVLVTYAFGRKIRDEFVLKVIPAEECHPPQHR